MVDAKAKTNIDTLKRDAAYPNLGKRASDGGYCYLFQRRISPYITIFCVRKGISANIATGIDLVLALMAAWSLSQGFYLSGSSAEFVGKTVFHRRLRRPRCSPSLKASLASSAAAPALTLGCAPRCRLVWAMGNGASGGGSGHRV